MHLERNKRIMIGKFVFEVVRFFAIFFSMEYVDKTVVRCLVSIVII